ncbi:sigma-70 family RNA polymerase sigma factor [bacterium]|nr:sigma-70 family RNA polymerase sigma factor [bacterium]
MADSYFNEDGLQDYLKRVGSHRLLSREEEVELFQRLEAGDESARDEIVRCNLRLVIKIAMQFKGMGVCMSDLIQEGNIGLLHVIGKFDWRRGFRFSTYAAFWIRQEIQGALRNAGSLIRLPIRKSRLVCRINEVSRYFARTEGREPGVDEIALFLDVDPVKVEELMPMRERVLSLDADSPTEGYSLLDTVPQVGPAPYESLNRAQVTAVVRDALDFLTERERNIMELRFGLNDGKAHSLRKTSRKVGLSQEGVRRIERRALDKLSRPAIRARLEGLLIA